MTRPAVLLRLLLLPTAAILAGALAMSAAAFEGEQPPTFTLPPLEDFSAIVERPLFSPTRRAPDDAAPAESAEPADDPGASAPLVLVGLTSGEGGGAVAVLRDNAAAREFQVWIGDVVAGWEVRAIEPRALVLRAAGEDVEVTLLEPEIPTAPNQH